MRIGGILRQFPLAFRLALREMRGGLKGFYIFLACIALGVLRTVLSGRRKAA